MVNIFVFLIIGVFLALLFFNLYFRLKVLKLYKILVQNKVQFDKKHMWNPALLEEEVIPKYPEQASEIRAFIGHIKKSVAIAVVLIVMITILGLFLHFTKN
ncbi:MAG: hypothetical protein IPM26_12140 [Saprospiraceae bacterium]|nr:hypothetical protein [Saprospiraceae bacterium]